MAERTKLPKNYENNPFFIATNGLSLLFDLARGVAIFLVVMSVLGLFGGGRPDTTSSPTEKDWKQFGDTLAAWTPSEWTLAIGAVTIVLLAVLMVSALFKGVSAYTSAQIAKGQKVGFGEAFRISFDHLWSFLWLQIIIFAKLFLWTLLLVIPGIIMSVRYSLASVAFYDQSKNLRGNAAIKESLRLTRGAWLTTFAGGTLFNMITFGIISGLVTTGSNAILYRQFDKLEDKKPAAHWLSWITLALPFVLLLLGLLFIFLLVVVIGLTGATLFSY